MSAGLTYSESKVGDVVGNVHGDTHISKVEAITQPDQSQSNNMMHDQLFKVLSRLLQHQHENKTLLSPVRCLQQIIGLDNALMRPVWESLEHASRVEVPYRGTAHNVHAKRTVYTKVDCGIELFHEARLFPTTLDAPSNGKWTNGSLHEELAGEAENDCVKGNKGEVGLALAIVNWAFWIGSCLRV